MLGKALRRRFVRLLPAALVARFGEITSAGEPRRVQFGLKLYC